MLKNFVEQTASNPGTGTVTLNATPVAGRQTWAGSGFTSGSSVFYVITDGTVGEWGMGTFTIAASNSISRDTVFGNTSGTTSLLNFTGTVRVYNALPAEKEMYVNGSTLPITGDLVIGKANPQIRLDKVSSGQSSNVTGLRGGAYRWNIALGDDQTESGANAGSAFNIARFDDSGNYIDAPITINRQTGAVNLSNAAATVSILGAVSVASTAYFGDSISTAAAAGLSVGTGGIYTTGSLTALGNITTGSAGSITAGTGGIVTTGSISTGTAGALAVGTGGITTTGSASISGSITVTGNYNGGASGAMTVGSGGIQTSGPIQARSASNGYVTLYPGGTATCGYTAFYTPDNTRRGYIGFGSGSNQLVMQSEAGWGWFIGGETSFSNNAYFLSGSTYIQNASDRALRFRNGSGVEQAAFWNAAADSHQRLQVNGLNWTWQTDGQFWTPGFASNASDGSYKASIKVFNTAGAGDANCASIGFECSGYYGTRLNLRSDGYFGLGGHSSGGWRWYSDPSGNMVASGNITAYSDPRLKEDIEPIQDALGIIEQLDGVRFTWNARSKLIGKPGSRSIGVLADQVKAVLPEIVTDSIEDPETNEVYSTVAYDKLVPVLIQAVKELSARVRELEAAR